ncbi:hypothetical protein GO013_07485 [Pseudodesulfovibrio sp. JC047]|uniref:hypothetical protein n=1 Tax=Pseudodesulfovibrio sp. JC047 TaxID=2683199 RepID=UPI0013D01F4B|nr:hypothetical protein [Pseudodesulfovibrio sp. JC047]NDV19261.1 hypothetical protein [Pseudodesulfovibrio sp. JC047]
MSTFWWSSCFAAKDVPYMKDIPSPGLATEVETDPGWNLFEMLSRSFRIDKSRYAEPAATLGEALAREISVNAGYTTAVTPSTQTHESGSGTKNIYKQAFNQTISFNGLSPYYARLTFYQYLEPSFQQGYEPDFSYSFGVANYSPDTLSLEYANYGGNRLNPKSGEDFTNFNSGTFTTTYRFEIPKPIVEFFHPAENASILGWASHNLTPEYEPGKWWKQWFGLGLSIPIWGKFSFWTQANIYPDSSKHALGDPDFIYGFGYYDWSPGGFILAYSSYASNSFPWSPDRGGSFTDGSIFFGYNFDVEAITNFITGDKIHRKKPSRTRAPWGPTRKDWGG